MANHRGDCNQSTSAIIGTIAIIATIAMVHLLPERWDKDDDHSVDDGQG